jgi:hypothetical protein
MGTIRVNVRYCNSAVSILGRVAVGPPSSVISIHRSSKAVLSIIIIVSKQHHCNSDDYFDIGHCRSYLVEVSGMRWKRRSKGHYV